MTICLNWAASQLVPTLFAKFDVTFRGLTADPFVSVIAFWGIVVIAAVLWIDWLLQRRKKR